MKKIAKWAMAAAFICGASVFTACSSDDDKNGNNDGTPALVLIAKTGSIDYFQQIESAFRDACKEKGLQALYYSTTGDNAYDEQVEAVKQLEQLKDKSIKGVIYAPSHGLNGETADAEVAAFAKKRGIPVILLDSKVDANSPLAGCPFFGTDDTAAGKAMAEEVTADKVAAFAVKNSPGIERAEAFKAVKPDADIYPCGENANSDIQAVIDQYDDFVFMNGTPLPAALDMLKKAGKNIYTFDIYDEFLDELIAGNPMFKGIIVQNTFLMTQKAVDAALAGAKEGEMIPTFFINGFNLYDDIVQPYLKFYNKPAAPVIDNLPEKLQGKWMMAEIDGKPVPTDSKQVLTYESGSKFYYSLSISAASDLNVWVNHCEGSYTINGNKLSQVVELPNANIKFMHSPTIISITDNDMFLIAYNETYVDGKSYRITKDLKERKVRVTHDYSADVIGTWEGRQTSDEDTYSDGLLHRWEFKADGTFVYYRLDNNGEWVADVNSMAEYFVDGVLMCMRWKNVGNDIEYRESWEIASIENGKMNWTAIRQKTDGSTYTATFQMSKVK